MHRSRFCRGEIDPKPLRVDAWEGGFERSSARIPAKGEGRFPTATRQRVARCGARSDEGGLRGSGRPADHWNTIDVLAHAPRGMRCVRRPAACRARAIVRRRRTVAFVNGFSFNFDFNFNFNFNFRLIRFDPWRTRADRRDRAAFAAGTRRCDPANYEFRAARYRGFNGHGSARAAFARAGGADHP